MASNTNALSVGIFLLVLVGMSLSGLLGYTISKPKVIVVERNITYVEPEPTPTNTLQELEVIEVVKEPNTLNPAQVQQLKPRAERYLKLSHCWDLDWDNRTGAEKEYTTLLEVGKGYTCSYSGYESVFDCNIDFELKQVGEVLDTRLISATVDLGEQVTTCDNAPFYYDWSELVQEQEDSWHGR